MKTLQKRVQVLYRFRCSRCKSKFEMTSEEKLENDWKFDSRENKNDLRKKKVGVQVILWIISIARFANASNWFIRETCTKSL